MVAVRPGKAPMTMPISVAQATLKSVSKFAKIEKALKRWMRPSSMGSAQGSRTRKSFSNE
jgi:hypothetical protein